MKTKISDLKLNDIVALKNGDIDICTNKRHRGCGAIILEKHHHVHDYQIDWQKTNELNNNKMKEKIYKEQDMKQFAFNCVSNFLSNEENKIEMKLVEVILDRVNNEFENFEKKESQST